MNIISVLKVVQEITGSKHLVTRPIGQKVRDQIIEIINTNEEKVVMLDFEGVGIVDYSGADELVVRLLTRILNGELGEKYPLLKNLTNNQEENIRVAFQVNKKYAALLVKENKVLLIGTVKKMLVDILQMVYNEGYTTARAISDEIQSEINLTGTKLLQLYKQRLVIRKEESLIEGGRQFSYKPVIDLKLEL